MNIEGIDIKDIEFGEPIEKKEPTYRDGYIRGIYRARNIIDSKQKEIEERYLEITPNDIYSMVFTEDIKENKTKIILKENKQCLK